MGPTTVRTDRRAAYDTAQSFPEFLVSVTANEPLWQALSRRAVVPDDLRARARNLPGRWHLLVLLEDWCGDAVNTVPVLSRLVEQAPNLTLRVLRRDEHPDLMDEHLTNGKRAIPVVMILDEHFNEVSWWGSRPRELQSWVTTSGMALPKPDRYRDVRRWYAVDRGRSAVDEILSLICLAAGATSGCLAA